MELLVTRVGNSIDLSRADLSAFDSAMLMQIKSKLSYVYKFRGTGGQLEQKTVYMCQESKDNKHIYLSFGLLFRLVPFLKSLGHNLWLQNNTPKDKRYDSLKPVLDNISDDKFRTGQKECFEAIIQKPCGVIQAPTGFGKTYLLGLLCNAFPNEKIHICTKSLKLVKEIYQRLSKVVDSIGMVGGGKRDLDKRVTVFTVDSIEYSRGDAPIFIYDECHTAAGPSYIGKILKIYPYARRYGFSATPEGRGDGADSILEMLFGPLIFKMTYDDGVKNGLISKIKVRWLQSSVVSPRGLSCSSKAYRDRYCIWENDARNKLIAADIHKHYNDTKVLVLVSTVAHAFALKQYLPEFEVNYASLPPDTFNDLLKKGLIPKDYQPLKTKDKEQLFQDFLSGKVMRVISTDVWNTGIDVPDLAVVYNVSGRVSKILNTQGAGRASRLFSGKDYGLVVDIHDRFGEYEGYSYSRFKTYKKLNWEQDGFQRSR